MCYQISLLPIQGANISPVRTQGDALGYALIGLSGRTLALMEISPRRGNTNLAQGIAPGINVGNDHQGGQETGKVDRKGGQKTREAILDMIADDARITSTQMAERIGINRSAISKHLKKLQENGIIRREGPDKGGKWCIIKSES